MLLKDKELFMEYCHEGSGTIYYFYTDNTYSCEDWTTPAHPVSADWKIGNETLYFKFKKSSPARSRWGVWENAWGGKLLVRLIGEALLMHEISKALEDNDG